MQKLSTELIQGLWPLPGGNNRYLQTLDQVLRWVAATSSLSKEEFSDWFMTQYSVGKGSLSGYLQVILKLGVLEVEGNGNVSVTPLGHEILNAEEESKARLVVYRFMRSYLAFPEVLAVYAQAGEPVHLSALVATLQPQFAQWTSDAQYEYRALWLLSCGCLRQAKGRYYEITDFGKQIAQNFPPQVGVKVVAVPEDKPPVVPENHIAVLDTLADLINDLNAAAVDGAAPERLERAIGEAFEYLGFVVHQLGSSGETDILIEANIGALSYRAIVDAKARKYGKLQDLEVYTLREHMQKNAADYAIVVAGSFADGKVARHAADNGIVLLRVSLLCEWLQLHRTTPLNLDDYRAAFVNPGVLADLPTAIKNAAAQRKHWGNLLVDLSELIQETYRHGLLQPLPANQLFTMLVTRLRGVRYSAQEVSQAIQFLSHPVILALTGEPEKGISQVMSRTVLVQTLRALADHLEATDAEVE